MLRGCFFSCLTLLSVALCSKADAITTKEVFAKYPNPYFVETGTFQGDGVQHALDAGFKDVYSVELSPYYFSQATIRFKNNKNVHLFLGDSSQMLSKMIQPLRKRVTFWLDGHYSSGNTARGNSNTPLMIELEAIKNHPIKTHTILIDDIRQCGTSEFDFIKLETIIAKLKEINPKYKIVYEDGFVKKDVLVAYIEK